MFDEQEEPEKVLRVYFSCFSIFIIAGIVLILIDEEKEIFPNIIYVIMGAVVVVPISIFKILKYFRNKDLRS